MDSHLKHPHEVGTWSFQQHFDNLRRLVVIQMPDGKRYVSRTTTKGLLAGWYERRDGQPLVCHITRKNTVAEVTEDGMRRLVVVGTEMETGFRGFDRKNCSLNSGDVYEVDAIAREGDTPIVILSKRLFKAKTPFAFTLREWTPTNSHIPELQRLPLNVAG